MHDLARWGLCNSSRNVFEHSRSRVQPRGPIQKILGLYWPVEILKSFTGIKLKDRLIEKIKDSVNLLFRYQLTLYTVGMEKCQDPVI